MKYQYLIVVLGLIIHSNLLAKCGACKVLVTPKDEINQNTMIMIEGHGLCSKLVEKLNVKHPIYLETDKHRVKLKVLQINKGMFLKSQVLLKPTSRLLDGKIYSLKIDNLDENKKQYFLKWNDQKEKFTNFFWKASNKKLDKQKPKWETKPKLLNIHNATFGCGRNVHVVFDLKFKDKSNVFIKTELYNLKTKKSKIYLLTPTMDSKLYVGYSKCSGEFKFEDNGKYKIRFSLIDIFGNTSDWSDWIEFKTPFKNK